MAPVPVVLSPKFQAYEAMVPSESVELVPLTLSVNPLVDVVNCASGASFGTYDRLPAG